MIVAYDIETLKDLFTATFVDMKTGVVYPFVVHKLRNDFKEMLKFIEGIEGAVGYNNIGFDYAVLDPFLYEKEDYIDMDGDQLAKLIYKRAQKVIKEDFKKDYDYPVFKQRDLFRIWHFNNKARATSLKYLQINMDWPNVQEMPISHRKSVKTMEEINTVLEYNLNDVLTTIKFYELTKDKIRMRKVLGDKYGVDFGNAPDTKIGERIFLHEMSRRSGIPLDRYYEEKTLRKGGISINECIIPTIEFSSPQFDDILQKMKKMVITSTRKADEVLRVMFDGMMYEFGFGGLHAVREPGVFENIESADVASYYPNLAISYRFYPRHLGEVFCDVYQQLYEERKSYPKKSDESTALKLALNGVYGMSNAPWSPFYDPAYTMSITINGQLLLAYLCEQITLQDAGRVIMANTDGIEVDVHDHERFKRICSEWQTLTKLQLEFSTYKKIGIRDVNNYIGVKEDGSVKEKGDYVCDREIYKDQSMKIVTKAVRDFFVNDTPIEKTINECNDIKMFLIGKRAKSGNLEYRRAENTNELIRETLPKNVRYYISHTGGSIVKILTTNGVERVVNLNKGQRMTLFNQWVNKPFDQYGVFKNFYINEADKLIQAIVKKQLQIF